MRRFFSGWRSQLALSRRLPLLFLLSSLAMGLGCIWFTPIGLSPDEPEHLARADGLLLRQIMGIQPAGSPGAGVLVNSSIYVVATAEFAPCLGGHPLPGWMRKWSEAITWSKAKKFCPTQMVNYLPAYYLPGALGLKVGQAMGFTPLNTVFFGRIFMLAVFIAIGMLALAVARQGRALLFALLTLPTTITLASSYSQDGLIIASGVLAAALLSRAAKGPRDAAWAGALALLELIACAKLPYAPLLLACLLPLAANKLRARALLVALAMVPPLLWLIFLAHGHFTIWPRGAYHPGPLWPGSRSIWLNTVPLKDSVLVLEAHPLQILLLPLTSLWRDWLLTCQQALCLVGWNDTPIWGWEFPSLAVSVIAACAGSALGKDFTPWRVRDRFTVVLALVCTFFAISLSAYTNPWNF